MLGPTTGSVSILANKRQQPAKEDGKEMASALKDFRKAISNAINSDAERMGWTVMGRFGVDSPLTVVVGVTERHVDVPIGREMEGGTNGGNVFDVECILLWNDDDTSATTRHRVADDALRGGVKACAPGATSRYVQLTRVSTHNAVAVTTEARYTFILLRDVYYGALCNVSCRKQSVSIMCHLASIGTETPINSQ
jgi:hypothetical protein